MLWRANLYIDETQAETRDAAGVMTQARVLDWNDLHPWNAPADSAKKVRKNALDVNDSEVATVSPWWGEAWGYNEWNRKFSLGQPFTGVATVGLDNLPVGDGTQTVELLSFTPIRSLKSPSGVEKATNIISGTVAYSYPKHGYEAAAAWTPQIEVKGLRQAGDPAWGFSTTGDPGSMDSPFDFIWKMRKTVGVLDDEIGASPNTYSWRDYDVTKPVGTIGTTTLQPSMFRYVPSLGLYLNTPWHETNEGYSASPNTIASIADDPDTWFVQTGALDYTSGETTYQIVYLDGADTHQMRRNASWIIEAGTDCIGFAQRAASWRYKDSDASADQAPYAWKRMPRGVMEYNLGAGTENPYDTFVAYGMDLVGYRKYPIADTTESDIVSHRRVKKVVNGVLTDSNDAPPSIEELRRVVPGDIWVKDSASLMETETKDHIAIVAYVPPNAMELDVDKLMEQILLIEGEYTNKIQSVIKKLSVGDYNHNNLLSDKTIYPGYVWKKDQVGLSLNCQSWAIRRLK